MSKPVYKIIDGKGRVLIPQELRAASGMEYGDIVRLELSDGRVTVKKIDIVEIGQAEPACDSRSRSCGVSSSCYMRRGRSADRKAPVCRRDLPARAPCRAAIREMPEEKQIAIAARLLELLQQRKENRHG